METALWNRTCDWVGVKLKIGNFSRCYCGISSLFDGKILELYFWRKNKSILLAYNLGPCSSPLIPIGRLPCFSWELCIWVSKGDECYIYMRISHVYCFRTLPSVYIRLNRELEIRLNVTKFCRDLNSVVIFLLPSLSMTVFCKQNSLGPSISSVLWCCFPGKCASSGFILEIIM